uniref:Uncharacterized protein n=1 Tax=Sphaerodactylus townsendi TaxID=933632 RepID=A0ACB8FK49_9SAUR
MGRRGLRDQSFFHPSCPTRSLCHQPTEAAARQRSGKSRSQARKGSCRQQFQKTSSGQSHSSTATKSAANRESPPPSSTWVQKRPSKCQRQQHFWATVAWGGSEFPQEAGAEGAPHKHPTGPTGPFTRLRGKGAWPVAAASHVHPPHPWTTAHGHGAPSLPRAPQDPKCVASCSERKAHGAPLDFQAGKVGWGECVGSIRTRQAEGPDSLTLQLMDRGNRRV